jgi:hypothetical protein
MDLKVTTLEGKEAGQVSLSDAIFGLEPREDIIARVVRWQLAKKQQGTRVALVTIRRALRSSAAVVRLMARLFAATLMTCRRRFALSACAMRCRPSFALKS